ncbi:MAG TPA: hypothetical protein PLM25_02215 [Limnochordia bacterium]|nr:hypothetical protein [Limnochordia bacterium]
MTLLTISQLEAYVKGRTLPLPEKTRTRPRVPRLPKMQRFGSLSALV